MNQSRAQWVRDIENGALVTLDFKCSKEAFAEKMQGSAMHGQTSMQPDPAVSSVFLTPEMCKELGTKSTCTLDGVHMHLPICQAMSRSGGQLYAHGTVHVQVAKEGVLAVELTFVPAQLQKDHEEGEVVYPTVVRKYTATPRMWTSYMTEDHSSSQDGMYVHGMRKAVSIIAWWACQDPPRVNTTLPVIPPDFTEEQFVQVLRAMQLEAAPAQEKGDEAHKNSAQLLARLQEQGEGGSPGLDSLLQVKVCEPLREQAAHEVGAHSKLSIYPIGMINTR